MRPLQDTRGTSAVAVRLRVLFQLERDFNAIRINPWGHTAANASEER